MKRRESVIENVIGYVSTLGNALRFIERPMNTEINSALAVFFFGLGERRKAARHERAHVSVVIFGCAVEFVGDESKRDVIRAEESAQRLEERATKSGVTGGISGERRSEVRAIEIAGGRAKRRKSWIADCSRIAIAGAGRAGSGIGFADASDRRQKS